MHTWVLFGQQSWKPKWNTKCSFSFYFPTAAFFDRCGNDFIREPTNERAQEMWFQSMISFARLHIMGQSNAYVSLCECQRSAFSYQQTQHRNGMTIARVFWTWSSHKKCSWNRFLISCTHNQHSKVDYLSFSHYLCFVSFFLFYYYYLLLLLLFFGQYKGHHHHLPYAYRPIGWLVSRPAIHPVWEKEVILFI